MAFQIVETEQQKQSLKPEQMAIVLEHYAKSLEFREREFGEICVDSGLAGALRKAANLLREK